MAYENLCMYCFEDMEGKGTCPHCGRDSRAAVPQIQMLPGTRVYHGRFLIGRALGQDASGIVYAALDTKKDNRLRIREYLPRDCAERLNDGAVVPIAGMEDQYEAGLKKLRASVESAEDSRQRHFVFEENGTIYVAQRKTPASTTRESDPEEDEISGSRHTLLFAGTAVGVLVVAAVLLITIFNGALPSGRDITQSPTLDPSQVWIPAATPTATPYVAPTFAALVDPELSWMDYSYEGDVEEEYRQQMQLSGTPRPTSRPTAKPTTQAGTAERYTLISTGSSGAEVRKLQQRLATLGWLEGSQVTGKYDGATRQAVQDFQNYINQEYSPSQKLSVDGVAGPKTQQWLYEVEAPKPTLTPKPRVTPRTQDDTVREGSPAARVSAVQKKLIALGLLPEDSADGSYGATTATAVRRFQQRVNQLQGYDVLEVSGVMDPLSLSFLDYYAEEWERLRKATAKPTATPRPTARPTATPTTRPVEPFDGDIDAGSPEEDIRMVQQLLIDIGMLPRGSADGVYGSATISAVADFQQWVNAQRGEQTLTVNGTVDQLTLLYLQYCKDHGMSPYGTATPRPTLASTVTKAPVASEPIEEPGDDDSPLEIEAPSEIGEPEEAEVTEITEPGEELEEIEEVEEGTEEISVGPDSPPESIRYIQQQLCAVGAMDKSGIDGVYGKATRRAVKRFQQWVNSIQGEGTLPETGLVDDLTRRALEYAYDHDLSMQQGATAPTEAPDKTEEIEAVEEIEAAEETEEVEYSEEPEEAQEISVGPDSEPESISYVQQMLSFVGALDEDNMTGVYDDATVEAVKRFQRWVNSVQGKNTLSATGMVDDRTRTALEYAYDHEMHIEGTDSSKEEEAVETVEAPVVGEVRDIDIKFGDTQAGDAVVNVPEGRFSVRWRASGDVDSFYVFVEDSAGQSIVSKEATDETSFKVNTDQMVPGEVYTMRLGVLPANGGQQDIVWRTVRFTLPAQQTLEPEPEPQAIASISAPSITIAGVQAGSSTITVDEDRFQISWTAEGDVESYYVSITDSSGSEITEPQYTTRTGFSLRSKDMQEEMLYTLTVGALPVGGTEDDMKIARAQFMKPAQATPAPTVKPTPEPTEAPTPTPKVATIGKPVINVGGSAYQKDGISYMTDSSIILSWSADGDVESYTIYVENQAGEQQEIGTTTDTSRTVNTKSLPAGVYTIYVGAMPRGGDREDMQWGSTRFGIPAPVEEVSKEPEAEPEETVEPHPRKTDGSIPTGEISGSTDAETIQQLQMRLYSMGLLSTDGLQSGVLDVPTLKAVAKFQEENGLEPLNPKDLSSVVDAETVRAIFTD